MWIAKDKYGQITLFENYPTLKGYLDTIMDLVKKIKL